MSKTLKGLVVAAVIHGVISCLVLVPMLVAHGDEGLGYVVPTMVLYFPVSLLAMFMAMQTHSTEMYIGVLLVAGGVWYGLLGYSIGWLRKRRGER